MQKKLKFPAKVTISYHAHKKPDAAYSASGQYELLGGFRPGGPLCFVDFPHYARFAGGASWQSQPFAGLRLLRRYAPRNDRKKERTRRRRTFGIEQGISNGEV